MDGEHVKWVVKVKVIPMKYAYYFKIWKPKC